MARRRINHNDYGYLHESKHRDCGYDLLAGETPESIICFGGLPPLEKQSKKQVFRSSVWVAEPKKKRSRAG